MAGAEGQNHLRAPEVPDELLRPTRNGIKFLEYNKLFVIPAKAGIQETPRCGGWNRWIPAFAGMTAD
ncbi:hypothetical protein [Azospirillum sp. TSA6c]|uniref:hypothetical protein n=1 Tax=unclassified Azospirillum TaxID=2630922 RepID=UPI0011B5BE30|nr:hypothetical protein [Azospirillum sp. TSA6c]